MSNGEAVHDCSLGVLGTGPLDAEIMFVGIAPGRDEAQRTHKPFTGQAGKLLDSLLKFVGLPRESVYTTNLICWWKDAPDAVEIAACNERFEKEVAAVRPRLMVCLGGIVTGALMPQARATFGKVQGGVWWSTKYQCWQLSTYHPAAYLPHRGSTFKVDIADGVRDFRKLQAVLDWQENPSQVAYRVAASLQEVDSMLEHFSVGPYAHEPGDIVAVDVETRYDGTEMLSIAFTCSHGTTHVPTALMYGPHWEILERANLAWTFHNGQFDSPMIRKLLHANLPIVEDTMLMSYSLDERGGGDTESDSGGTERSVGIHGLKRLAREYCAAGFYDAAAHGRIDQLTPDELAQYNSCDAAYTYKLAHQFIPRQIEDGVRQMYLELLVPAANTLAEIAEHGAYIDQIALRRLALEWLPEYLDTEVALQSQAVSMGWPAAAPAINLGSWQQLGKLLYDVCGHSEVGKSGRSTKMAVLKVIAEESGPIGDFCRLLLEWRGLNHDITNYIQAIPEAIDSSSRIHPEALIHGTRVGRTSYHAPPVQTIPKARTVGAKRARIRTIFASPHPEVTLIEADFRQAELWAATMVSGDTQMLEDLQSGDFHARVAESTFGVTKETCDPDMWELYRDSSKILVYGKFYGAGVDALMGDKAIQGRGSTGSYVLFKTRREAEEHIKNFDERYQAYYQWREAEKKHVMAEGEQQSLTGRKRRYYWIQDYKQLNQAINMPISSLSHDFLLASLIELHPLLKPFGAHIWFEVHDSIVMEVPKVFLKEVVELVTRVMQKPRWGTPFGIPVDIKEGPNWLDLHRVGG